MSHGKQFTLYSHQGGPNGWKVALFMEELGLTYETVFLDFNKQEQKQSPHIDLNPNGRIPTIIDHKNGDFVLYESNAILIYLADAYDKEHKFSVEKTDEKFKQLQWLFFQSSGQGPYFGQWAWFTWYHPEKIPSAIERYEKEIKRVFGVLEIALAKQDWLAGDKYTIADLSFITWSNFAFTNVLTDYDASKEIPRVDAWFKKMMARPAIKKVYADREAANKK